MQIMLPWVNITITHIVIIVICHLVKTQESWHKLQTTKSKVTIARTSKRHQMAMWLLSKMREELGDFSPLC